jgi:hypothetical protein
MHEFFGVLLVYLLARAEHLLPNSFRAQCWAWLGCYRTALQSLPITNRCSRSLAIRALAACGLTTEAEKIVRSLRGPRQRKSVATAVAAFHPALAAELFAGSAPTPLQAAVLTVSGNCAAARKVLEKLPLRVASAPAVGLLRANCRLLDAAEALNRCFREAGLTEIAAADSPPGPLTLHPHDLPAPVDGPLVSVIFPAHNTEALVSGALQSLCQQTWSNLEILAVDDASNDGTLEQLRRLAAEDGRVKVLSHSRNAGPYAARMTALAEARGEFVTCHDSDDWAHPQRIEKQVLPLVRHRHLTATVSDWVRMTDDGAFYVRKSWPLIHHNPASVMFRRNIVLERMGGFDLVRAGADSEFYERLKIVFGATAVRRTKGILAVGSHRPGSLMNDPKIGVTNHVLSPSRLAYWEAWRRWHVESLRAGQKPFMPPDGQRPFEAPRELLLN